MFVADPAIQPATRARIDAGLNYLSRRQHADGHWGSPTHRLGISALSVLAMMSDGSLPCSGRYQDQVDRGIRFLVNEVSTHGFDGYKLYNVGLCAVTLSQAHGMMCNPADARAVQDALDHSVQYIVDAQFVGAEKEKDERGGWGYFKKRRPDSSLSVMQLMALRASRECGISVPQHVIDNGVGYLRRNQSPHNGNFTYKYVKKHPRRLGRRHRHFNLTAGAVASLLVAGVPQTDDATLRGFEFLQSTYMNHTIDSRYGIYGTYYACHAFQRIGGPEWEQYYAHIERMLSDTQVSGGWRSPMIPDDVATSMAIICLCSPRRLLPLFARM
jgi:hypothetical protein